MAANSRLGCKLAFGLQPGNWQRIFALAANLQRIGVWAANRQRTGVWAANWRLAANWQSAANWRLGCTIPSCVELPFWLQIGVLATNWRSGCELAANLRLRLRLGCIFAFGLQTGNWQRNGVLAAHLQRIGVWAANRQRIGVWAAKWQSATNWRLGCNIPSCVEFAFDVTDCTSDMVCVAGSLAIDF